MSRSPESRFWEKVNQDGPKQDHMETNCWEWTGFRTKDGYGRFRLEGHSIGAHRFSFEGEHGEVPADLCVLHHCDHPPCIRPDHLYLGSKKNNAEDRERRQRGNHARGDRHGTKTHPGLHSGQRNSRVKLSEASVRSIRAAFSDGVPQAALADMHAVSRQAIFKIVNRLTWRLLEV